MTLAKPDSKSVYYSLPSPWPKKARRIIVVPNEADTGLPLYLSFEEQYSPNNSRY